MDDLTVLACVALVSGAGEGVTALCPHGDPTCPCPDGDPCHYEGRCVMACPNPPPNAGSVAHCHVEGCSWRVSLHVGTRGECGLLKLGLPPLRLGPDEDIEMYSMTQARPGLPGWACGFLRTPLNVASKEDHGA